MLKSLLVTAILAVSFAAPSAPFSQAQSVWLLQQCDLTIGGAVGTYSNGEYTRTVFFESGYCPATI